MIRFSPETEGSDPRLVMLLSLLLQGVAACQYALIRSVLTMGRPFAWQFAIFLGASAAASCAIGLSRKSLPVFLGIRLFLIFLIGYPLGRNIWLELVLLLSLLLEAGLLLRPPYNLWGMGAAAGAVLGFQRPVSAFHRNLPGPALQDLMAFAAVSLVVVLLISGLSRLIREMVRRQRIIDRLDEALSRLGKANLGFQNMSTNMEQDTLKRERKRVSREIHDSVGYSLTNIRIMLDAASLMLESDPAQAKEFMFKSMNEAGICLEETRDAMRQLRSKEQHRLRGMKSFFQLVALFGEATGIRVNIEFGNAPDSFGDRIDKAVFRFIQEGLTNSFRHGRATEIGIYFWIQDRRLRVSLQDNGSGAEDLAEGIGLAGMKERLEDLGGRLSYQNLTGGFEISILIPLERRSG